MREGRSETDDEGLTSDECSEEDCDYECWKRLGSFQQGIAEKNGVEWVKCGCGQWIHEDCIDQLWLRKMIKTECALIVLWKIKKHVQWNLCSTFH